MPDCRDNGMVSTQWLPGIQRIAKLRLIGSIGSVGKAQEVSHGGCYAYKEIGAAKLAAPISHLISIFEKYLKLSENLQT